MNTFYDSAYTTIIKNIYCHKCKNTMVFLHPGNYVIVYTDSIFTCSKCGWEIKTKDLYNEMTKEEFNSKWSVNTKDSEDEIMLKEIIKNNTDFSMGIEAYTDYEVSELMESIKNCMIAYSKYKK